MQDGTTGNDTIVGSDEIEDWIDGLGGDDWIQGGDEVVAWGDVLYGGTGSDTLIGGAGKDQLYADWSFDGGHDSLEGGAGSDSLNSWSGNDTLRGGLDGDTFSVTLGLSEERTVWVYGEDGEDFIVLDVTSGASAGSVMASGGTGRDGFGFNMDWSPKFAFGMVVTDFQAGSDGDFLGLHELLEYSSRHDRGYEGGNAFHDSQGYLRLVQSGANTLLQYDEDGLAGGAYGWHTAMTLLGVDRSSLTADNLSGMPSDGTALAGRVIVESALGEGEGTSFDDTITGGGWGHLQGHGGNDWIEANSGQLSDGGAGDDTLVGGRYNDFLRGQSGDDLLLGRSGADRMRVHLGEGSDTLVAGGGDDFVEIWLGDAAGAQVVRFHGGRGDDRLVVDAADGHGNDDAVVASGGEGQDTFVLKGSPGIDLLVTDFSAGAGGDRLDLASLLLRAGSIEERHCLRLVRDGGDMLLQYDWDGRAGSDDWQTAVRLRNIDAGTIDEHNFTAISVTGTPGADTLQGGFGADDLKGGGGNDFLHGGRGGDRMEGGGGNDLYVVDNSSDQVIELVGSGTDTVVAHVDYVLGSVVENLILRSGATIGHGNDLGNSMLGSELDMELHGHGGNDSLSGWEGADTLTGGMDADQLQGGAGNDLFRFTTVADSGVPADARDIILDFSPGAGGTAPGDAVDLSLIDAITGNAGNDAFTFIGDAQFGSANAAGQLRFEYVAARDCVVLYGSVDADGDAEFAIEFAGIDRIAAADLLL